MEWSSVLRLFGAGCLALLALLLYGTARARRGPWWRRLPALLACLTAATWLWALNRWDLSSVWLRPLYPPLLALAAVLALGRPRAEARAQAAGRLRTAAAVVVALANLAVVALLAPSLVAGLRGYLPPAGALDLRSPLRGGHFFVVQGGSDLLTNHHVAAPAQRHAIDIVAVNRAGLSQRPIREGSLADYLAFGRSVVAPCDGTVRAVRDGLADRPAPNRSPTRPAGNHVVLRCGDALVLLAHLREGSVAPVLGDRLRAGDPIGEIGNSGNTTEPHLHLHAVRAPRLEDEGTLPDTLAPTAQAVPITIEGRYLVRGSRVPRPRS